MGILGTFQVVLDVLIFFLLVALVYALIGTRVLGPIDTSSMSESDIALLETSIKLVNQLSFCDLMTYLI